MHSRLLREVRKVAELFAWWQAHCFSYCSGVLVGWELDHKEGWAPKNWCFQTMGWRRLLTVPGTARRSNRSIVKEINPECSLEGLVLKLNLQYFGHLMLRANSLEDSDVGKDWGQEEKGTTEDEMVGWHHQLNGHEFEQALGSWWWTGKPGVLQCMRSQRVKHNSATEQEWKWKYDWKCG